MLVGELRDVETMEVGLHAAETGHLVLSTLHTLNAAETINRMISMFPPHQEEQIRGQLASVIQGIVSQRLVVRADGRGRVPAVEGMIATGLIRDCIREAEKTPQIPSVIAGFMRVLKMPFISKFEGRIINLPPSLLPSFPGLDGIGQAFRRGVKVTGCTVHHVTLEVDGGPIVDQAPVRIQDNE